MEESFLARWSRRKIESRRREQEEEGAVQPSAEAAPTRPVDEQPAADAPPPEQTEPAEAPAADAPSVDIADLPPVDSLTAASDFRPFLRPGIPEDLKRAALRKLWTSDPSWAQPEILDLHNLDYTLPPVPEIVRTAYRVGRGFLDATEGADDTAEAEAKTLSHEEPQQVEGAGEPALETPKRGEPPTGAS